MQYPEKDIRTCDLCKKEYHVSGCAIYSKTIAICVNCYNECQPLTYQGDYPSVKTREQHGKCAGD